MRGRGQCQKQKLEAAQELDIDRTRWTLPGFNELFGTGLVARFCRALLDTCSG